MYKLYQQSDGWAVTVHQLVKNYGDQCALQGIDLTVEWGDRLAIFGPNGAGKTTLLKVLAGLTKPSSGSVRVGGMDLREDAINARRQIGVVTHQTLLYDDLTAYENLKFYGKMYNVANLSEKIGQLLNAVNLESRAYDLVRTLSRGMQQRLAIARASIHDPPILLLDEPGTGLDQEANHILLNIINSTCDRQRTVILTTHSLEQGLALSKRVVILTQGKIAYEETNMLDTISFREVYYQHTGVRN